MAQVPKTSLKQFKDGPPPVKAADLNQNNEVLRTAINDNDVRIGSVEADGSVTTAKLANGAVTTVKIADSAVTAPKLASGAVITDKLLDRSVTAPKIALTAVGTEHLQDLSVTSAKLAEGAVTSTKLGANAVTSSSIANGAVTTDKLVDLGTTTAKLGNNVVTTEKLADGAVTGNALGANSVTTAKIADKSITAAKLADNAITAASLNVYTKPETDTAIADALAGGLPPEVVEQITGAISQDVADLKIEVGGVETDVANLKDADIALRADITALQQAVPPDASTTQKGIVQLSNDRTSNSITTAPTSRALNTAYNDLYAGSYRERGNVPADWNTATSSGSYTVSLGSWTGYSNYPAGAYSYGKLVVFAGAGARIQMYFTHDNPGRVFQRVGFNDTDWRTWTEITTSASNWQKHKLTADDGSCNQLSAGTDLNNVIKNGFYTGEGLLNCPIGSALGNWAYIEVMTLSADGAYVIQKLYSLFGSATFYMRTRVSGTWSPWSQDLFTSVVNGKGAVAGAINGKGGSASASNSFAELAAAVTAIPTAKVSNGTLPGNTSINPDAGSTTDLPATATVSYNVPAGFPISRLFIYLSGYTYAYSSGWTNVEMPSGIVTVTPSTSAYTTGPNGSYDVSISGNTITIKMTSKFLAGSRARYYNLGTIIWWAQG